MPKRKRRAEGQSFPEYDTMTVDQLYGERRSIGIQMQAIGRQYTAHRVRHEYLTTRIRSLRNGETGIGISDHAVVRYLERVKGMDITAVRNEIRSRAVLKDVPVEPDQIVKDDDGVSFAIYDGYRLATIWTPKTERLHEKVLTATEQEELRRSREAVSGDVIPPASKDTLQ